MCAVADDPKMVKTQFAPERNGIERIWGLGAQTTVRVIWASDCPRTGVLKARCHRFGGGRIEVGVNMSSTCGG